MLLPILILLHEKFLQFDWLRAVVFQLNLKYLCVKTTNLLWVVVYFEISLVVYMPNITTNHAIAYTNFVSLTRICFVHFKDVVTRRCPSDH